MFKIIVETKAAGLDIAVIQTSFGYSIRYGLEVESGLSLGEALKGHTECLAHALAAQLEGVPA